jgi:hypothetical protein
VITGTLLVYQAFISHYIVTFFLLHSLQTASRMESNGLPNLIHLSSDMYQAVDALTNDFEFTCCGKIQVKGKGEMTTYLARPLR